MGRAVRIRSLAGIASNLALVALLVSCARAPETVPGATPGRPAEKPGPFNTTYAQYNPALFGPERPLDELIARYHLRLRDGRLADARLLLNKAQRRLELWVKRRMVKAYRIQLGANPTGRKTRRGDQRTPEGKYIICDLTPSTYCESLWISYPNLDDARDGLRAGVITTAQYDAIVRAQEQGKCPPQDTALGGYLWLHGQLPENTQEAAREQRAKPGGPPPGLQVGDIEPSTVSEFYDWTAGCAGMFNPDIRELYRFIAKGTPITIVPNGPITAPQKR